MFPFVFERLPSFYLHVSTAANDDDDDDDDDRDDHDHDDDDTDSYDRDEEEGGNVYDTHIDDDNVYIIIIITYHHGLDSNRTLQVTNRKICASTAGACPYNS